MSSKRGLVGLLLGGIFALPATGHAPIPKQPDPSVLEAQDRKFALERLYDTSTLPESKERHQVFISYEAAHHRETGPFRKHETQILTGVQELYAKHGIDVHFLKYLPVHPDTNHVILHVLDEDRYRTVIPASEFLKIWSAGFADVKRRTAYVKGWLSDLEYERFWTEEFISVSIDTAAHEIGHLLMLPHAKKSMLGPHLNDLMWEKSAAVKGCAGLCSDMTDEETRIIHSYLSKGQIYAAYAAAGDFIPYTLRLEQAKIATIGAKKTARTTPKN